MSGVQSDPIMLGQHAAVRDAVLPFQIEGVNARGRTVRLSSVLTEILAAHAYPPRVAAVLAEALVLASLLGSLLKEAGQLTLQARSDGPIRLLVVDFKIPGDIRGYAEFDPAAIADLPVQTTLHDLFGKGYLGLTLEQGEPPERYQAIVPLEGETLADCARGYFESSEQVPSSVALAARFDPISKCWIAGGLLLQFLSQGEEGRERLFAKDTPHEGWSRVQILMQTLRPDELTDPSLPLEALLWRLFHEDGVRVYEPLALARGCRCSRDRIQGVLRQFSFAELMEMREADGAIRVNCAFCSKDWVFERPEERG